MSYTVILEQDPDGGYVAIVPALPGCVSQGETRAEVMANIREAVPNEAGKEFLELQVPK
jgi:predicted RNase H-like HicB family nuclease